MEDLAVFTALNHSGSFGKNFVKFQKNKYVIYRLRVGPYGKKLWPRSWKCCPRAVFSRPRSQFFTKRTSQPANNIYISTSYLFSEKHLRHNKDISHENSFFEIWDYRYFVWISLPLNSYDCFRYPSLGLYYIHN